jgi:hypothetical protein
VLWAGYEGQEISLKCCLAVKLKTKPNGDADTFHSAILLQAAVQDLQIANCSTFWWQFIVTCAVQITEQDDF